MVSMEAPNPQARKLDGLAKALCDKYPVDGTLVKEIWYCKEDQSKFTLDPPREEEEGPSGTYEYARLYTKSYIHWACAMFLLKLVVRVANMVKSLDDTIDMRYEERAPNWLLHLILLTDAAPLLFGMYAAVVMAGKAFPEPGDYIGQPDSFAEWRQSVWKCLGSRLGMTSKEETYHLAPLEALNVFFACCLLNFFNVPRELTDIVPLFHSDKSAHRQKYSEFKIKLRRGPQGAPKVLNARAFLVHWTSSMHYRREQAPGLEAEVITGLFQLLKLFLRALLSSHLGRPVVSLGFAIGFANLCLSIQQLRVRWKDRLLAVDYLLAEAKLARNPSQRRWHELELTRCESFILDCLFGTRRQKEE